MAVGPRLTVCPDCGYQWAPPTPAVAPPPIPHGAIAAAQPKPNSAAPFLWLALIVGGICGASAIVGAIQNRPEPTVGARPVASIPEPTNEAVIPRASETTSLHSSSWRSIVGNVDAGMKVYWQETPSESPALHFTILNPYIEGNDGILYMEVQYPSGRTELLDRRRLLRSQAALAGQYVYQVH